MTERLMYSEKDPGEKIVYSLSFTNLLGAAETISSCSVTITTYLGTDTSPSSCLSGGGTVVGAAVFQTVIAGTEGNTYRLRAQALTSDGRILVGAGYIPVNAP